MVNLVLAIMCSSGNSLIMKFAESKSNNKISLLLINYLVAVSFGSILMLEKYDSFGQRSMSILPVLSLINGVLYVSTFLLLQLNIHKNGATISASLSHMGLMIPVLLSIIFFGEYPNIKQLIGIVAAIGALIIISLPWGSEKINVPDAEMRKYRWLLTPMIISGGMADTMSKVFEVSCEHSLEDMFLSITFLVALFICAIVCFCRKERINKCDLIFGVALGVSNYLSTKFLIRSIYIIPAYMAYISYGLGVVIFVNLVNLLFMHETLTKRDYAGMVLAMSSIVLLNII